MGGGIINVKRCLEAICPVFKYFTRFARARMCVTIFRIISFNTVCVYVCRLNDETRRLYESGWRYNGMKGWQGTTVYVCVSPVIWHYYAPPLKNGYIRLYDVVRVCGGVLAVGGTAEGNKINLPVICFLFFSLFPLVLYRLLPPRLRTWPPILPTICIMSVRVYSIIIIIMFTSMPPFRVVHIYSMSPCEVASSEREAVL